MKNRRCEMGVQQNSIHKWITNLRPSSIENDNFGQISWKAQSCMGFFFMIVSAALLAALDCISLLMLHEKRWRFSHLRKCQRPSCVSIVTGHKRIKKLNNREAMVISQRHSSMFKYAVKWQKSTYLRTNWNLVCLKSCFFFCFFLH